MPEKIFIGVAWPYANGSLHLGQIAGAYLPPDIFARYHRLQGQHRAHGLRQRPARHADHRPRRRRRARRPRRSPPASTRSSSSPGEQLGISFDLYTTTGTENHAERRPGHLPAPAREGRHLQRQDAAALLHRRAALPASTATSRAPAPSAASTGARGDQCDNCGNPLDPEELIDARCKFGGSTPEVRESEHFFLRLSAFNEQLKAWLSRARSTGGATSSTSRWARSTQGLRDRAITRDIEWGVPIPLPGYEQKRIYVWFEAVIGYLSAAKEWAQLRGEPEAWRDFWEDPACKSYYFIGKDNISFHTLIWPAMLMGYGGLNLPYDVPANQYLNLGGGKASTSRGTAPFLPDYLARYDPDTLRYYLAADHAGDRGHRLQRGRPHSPQQRRAGRDLGQPGAPRPHLHLPPLRRSHPAAGGARRRRVAPCWSGRRPRWTTSARTSPSATSAPVCRRRWASPRRRTAISTTRRPGRRSATTRSRPRCRCTRRWAPSMP